MKVPVSADLAAAVTVAAEGWHACELAWREAEYGRRLDDLESVGPVGTEEKRRLGVVVRRDAAVLRSGRWPTVDELVARALSVRLDEEDMRGPWPPLSRTERAQLRRPGRRPYTSYARYADLELDDHLAATLPGDLVWRARTAAYRWNEREVAPRLAEVADDRAACAEIYGAYGQSLGRLAREALDRHLAVPPSDPSPTAAVDALVAA